MVEQRTENPCVGGSIPPLATSTKRLTVLGWAFSFYVLTSTGIAEKVALTSRFLKRKIEEYDGLKAEIEVLKSEVEKPGEQGTQKA